MTKHTQGPWRIQGENKDTVTFDAFGSCAQLCGRNLQSNATLIAAAPDLLEALIALEKKAVEMRKLIDPKTWAELESMATTEIINAREAIAKAEGRSNE